MTNSVEQVATNADFFFFSTGSFQQCDKEESGVAEMNLTEVISVSGVTLITFCHYIFCSSNIICPSHQWLYLTMCG